MQYATDYHVYIRRDKRITTTYVMRDRWMNHWWASPGNAGRSGSRNSTDAPLHFGEAYNWIVCSSRVRAGFLLRSNEKPLNTHVRKSLIRTQKGTKLRRNERGWTTVSHAACVYPCRIVIGPVLFSCTAALVQLVRMKESMFVSFQLIALVQQCS